MQVGSLTKRPPAGDWRLLVMGVAGVTLTMALAQAGIARAAGPVRVAEGNPYSQNEIQGIITPDEAKIADLRAQEIKQLRITLGRREPSNRRADLYFRLAEIDLEAYQQEFLWEGRAHEKRIEKGAGEAFIDRTRSRPYLRQGIEASESVLKLHIPFPKVDRVYYFLAFNYGELGDQKRSLAYFTAIVQKYPNSPFATEAYRELGDRAYGEFNYPQAQKYYERAIQGRDDETMPRILHKLAWSYYRQRQYDRAVATMKNAIDRATRNGEKSLSLKEEALRDMAIFMTETGQVEEAIEYFQRVSGDKAFYARALEKLGKQYERNADPMKAIQVYETLLKTSPDGEPGFRVRAKLVDLDLRRGHTTEALARLKGAKIYTEGEPDTVTAAQNLRAMIRRTATENHELFRKNGSRPALLTAETYYASYLDLFLAKNDPRKETPEIEMYLADVKRELGKAQEASDLYRKVLDTGDSRYAKEAGALWTGSLADAIHKNAQDSGKAKGGTDPSPLELEFVQASDTLQKALGDLPESRDAALKSAQVLAGYKNTQDDALKRCRKIMDQWPRSTQALTASHLYIQILSDRLPASSSDLASAIQSTRANSALMAYDQESGQGKLKIYLGEQETRMKVGMIATQERANDYGAAAKGYEDFGRDATKKDVAEKSFANAVSAYTKADDFDSADRVTTLWQKRYSTSPQLKDAILTSATAALIRGQYRTSGKLFEKLGRRGSDPEALETAARLYEGSGDSSFARAAWTSFLRLYRKSPRRFTVALALAQSFEADRQEREAVRYYKECEDSASEISSECGARLGDMAIRLSDRDSGKAAFRRVAKGSGSSPFVAYARYRLAELMEQDTHFDRLELPEAKLKKALGQRLNFLEPLSKAYLQAVEAGGPWAVAALDRLANFASDFADDVDHIAPAANADPAAAKQFKVSLQQSVSGPLRQKAVESWSQAFLKATQSEVLSPVLPRIADHLADAQVSNQVHRAQGYRGRFRLSGISADGGAEGRTGAFERVRDRLMKNAQDSAAWSDYGNLLWGEGKPLLAKIAYERSLDLNHANVAALNNLGVVFVSGNSEEDWFRAAEANAYFKRALASDEFFMPAKLNRATLLNYYRIFGKAKGLWDQVVVKYPIADAFDGLAIALQGSGEPAAADRNLNRAADAGAGPKRFARVFYDAARAVEGVASAGAPSDKAMDKPAEKCLTALRDMNEGSLSGFERDANDNLKRICTQWKSGA